MAAENEVELEVLVVRSRPSCLMLSSTGWEAVTSFQSCWRSEGHTATARGESTHCQRGEKPTGTHTPGCLGTPWAPSLPIQLRQPSMGRGLGNHDPKLGTVPLSWQAGGKGCTAPLGSPKQATHSTYGTLRSCTWKGGDPSSLHPGTPWQEEARGLILHTTQLKLFQAIPAVNTITSRSLRKNNTPAPSPALPHPEQGEAAATGAPQHVPNLRQVSLPWGRVCRGTVPCPGGRLTSPWRCRFKRCCCWSCCICRSCCWKASCLFPNGCQETKGRNQSVLFSSLAAEARQWR